MTLSALDPRAALVVVDLQKSVVGLTTAHPTADVVARSARLAAVFRRHALPVVLVNAAGRAPGRTEATLGVRAPSADGTELVPELDPQPGDVRVTKRTWGAFHGTDLPETG